MTATAQKNIPFPEVFGERDSKAKNTSLTRTRRISRDITHPLRPMSRPERRKNKCDFLKAFRGERKTAVGYLVKFVPAAGGERHFASDGMGPLLSRSAAPFRAARCVLQLSGASHSVIMRYMAARQICACSMKRPRSMFSLELWSLRSGSSGKNGPNATALPGISRA